MIINQRELSKLSTKFIFALIVLFITKPMLLAEANEKLVVLVSVKYENLHRVYYNHVTSKSTWKTEGNKELSDIIYSKFGTRKYSISMVNPGRCYIIYSKKLSSGEVKHYSQTHHSNIDTAHSEAKKKDLAGYKTLDVGCNDGIAPDATSAQNHLELTSFIDDVFKDNVSKRQYRCSKNNNRTFKVIKQEKTNNITSQASKNLYVLKSGKGQGGVVNTVKIKTPQLNAITANSKKDISKFLNELTDSIERVCSSGSESSMKIFGRIKQTFIKKMNAKAKKCKENKEDSKKCSSILRHSVYASMSVRG